MSADDRFQMSFIALASSIKRQMYYIHSRRMAMNVSLDESSFAFFIASPAPLVDHVISKRLFHPYKRQLTKIANHANSKNVSLEYLKTYTANNKSYRPGSSPNRHTIHSLRMLLRDLESQDWCSGTAKILLNASKSRSNAIKQLGPTLLQTHILYGLHYVRPSKLLTRWTVYNNTLHVLCCSQIAKFV